MVAARMPSCSVSAMTRATNFSLAAAEEIVAGVVWVAVAAGEMPGRGTEPDDVAGETAAADGDPLAALGAGLLPGFAASPAACLLGQRVLVLLEAGHNSATARLHSRAQLPRIVCA